MAPSSARSTADAFTVVSCLDRSGKLDDSPQHKKQKAATALHRNKLYGQDFAGPVSIRAPRILGPISRFRIVACFSSWTSRLFLTHPLDSRKICLHQSFSSAQEPPHKLIHHTTDRDSVLFAPVPRHHSSN